MSRTFSKLEVAIDASGVTVNGSQLGLDVTGEKLERALGPADVKNSEFCVWSSYGVSFDLNDKYLSIIGLPGTGFVDGMPVEDGKFAGDTPNVRLTIDGMSPHGDIGNLIRLVDSTGADCRDWDGDEIDLEDVDEVDYHGSLELTIGPIWCWFSVDRFGTYDEVEIDDPDFEFGFNFLRIVVDESLVEEGSAKSAEKTTSTDTSIDKSDSPRSRRATGFGRRYRLEDGRYAITAYHDVATPEFDGILSISLYWHGGSAAGRFVDAIYSVVIEKTRARLFEANVPNINLGDIVGAIFQAAAQPIDKSEPLLWGAMEHTRESNPNIGFFLFESAENRRPSREIVGSIQFELMSAPSSDPWEGAFSY